MAINRQSTSELRQGSEQMNIQCSDSIRRMMDVIYYLIKGYFFPIWLDTTPTVTSTFA